MTAPGLSDYLDHVRQAACEAIEFVQGMDKADRRTQHAVIRCLTIIGEAATKIMEAHAGFVEVHPEVPWLKIRGMRNRVVHGYLDINLDTVWDTALTDLPALLARLPAVES